MTPFLETGMKKLLILLLILMLMVSCMSCKKNDAKEGQGKKDEETQQDSEDPGDAKQDDDSGEDTYAYPEGDWGEGFNYGTVRGRWRAETYGGIETLNASSDKTDYILRLMKAMDVEPPQVCYKIMMRFIDESHMEGRFTIDESAFYDTIITMYATEDGIKRLYGAMYGLSKNEAAEVIRRSGTTVSQLATQMRQILEANIGDGSALIRVHEINGTYSFDGDLIKFQDEDLCLEFNQKDGSLTIHAGDMKIPEMSVFDGISMTKQ